MEIKPKETTELSSIQEAAKHAMECLQKLSREDDAFILLTVEGKNDGDVAEGSSLFSCSSRTNLVFQHMLVQAMEQHPEVLEEIIEPAYLRYKLEHFEELGKKEKSAFLAFATAASFKTLKKVLDKFHLQPENN